MGSLKAWYRELTRLRAHYAVLCGVEGADRRRLEAWRALSAHVDSRPRPRTRWAAKLLEEPLPARPPHVPVACAKTPWELEVEDARRRRAYRLAPIGKRVD